MIYKTNYSTYDSYTFNASSAQKYVRFLLYNEHHVKCDFQNEMKIKLTLGIVPKRKVFTKTTRFFLHFEFLIDEDEFIQLVTPSQCLHINLKIKPVRNVVQKTTDLNNSINFKTYLFNDALSDVVFKIDDTELPAHKIMLASASPVFEKMFSHQMKENITNVVVVEETDPDIFKEMLSFIYTGEVDNLETMACGLYELANRYDISNLKLLCEEFLEGSLSSNNVIPILELADCHNSMNLKKKCIEYMDDNFEKIGKTEAFKNMRKQLLLEFVYFTRLTQ